MDYQALLYDPIYDVQGVDATVTPGPASTVGPADVTVLNRTAGVELPGAAGVDTVKPGALVRMAELTAAGLERADLEGGTLDMGAAGGVWTIDATLPRPSPRGEADGELLLILSEA